MYRATVERFGQQERSISGLEARLADLQLENEELARQLQQRRQSVDSAGEFHHAKNPSVLSDCRYKRLKIRYNVTTIASQQFRALHHQDDWLFLRRVIRPE